MNRTTLRPLIAPTLGWIAIGIAAIAQYVHVIHHADEIAIGLFITAIAGWLWAIGMQRVNIATRLHETSTVSTSARPISKSLVISVIALAGLTFLFSGGNEFNSDNVLAWVLSIGVFLYAFWEPEKNWDGWRAWWTQSKKSVQDFLTNGIRLSPHVLALLGIILVAIFFYYHDLDGVPAEMTSDHAEKLLDVNDIVTKGLRPIFLERNTGREPLQFYLTAAFIGITNHPIDHMALKLITAMLGVLVIPFTFLFVREMFDDDVALFTALFIAFSKWGVTIARMGLRFPLTPVFVAPLMFFLWRALKYQRRNDFLMAGLVLGIGLHGYNAFRVAPILVAICLVLWLLLVRPLNREQLHRYVINSFLMFALMIIIMMPLLRYMSEHPGNFWYRMATRLTDVESPIKENPIQIFAGNLVNASLMFNWTGDEAWPNSIPDDPALEYVTGALFLLGTIFAIYRLVRYREMAYAFVIVGIATMLLPSTLSIAFPNENPSVVRAGGAIPFVFILVALPIAWFTRVLKQSLTNEVSRIIAGIAIGSIIVISMLVNYTRYFNDFDESYRRLSWNSSEVAAAIRSYAGVVDLAHTWILLYPHWIDTRNVAINLRAIGWEQTLPEGDKAREHLNDPASKLYILNPGDAANLTKLREIFPDGQERRFSGRTPGHDFLLYYVPGVAPTTPLK